RDRAMSVKETGATQGRMRLRCVAAIGTQKRERSVVIGGYYTYNRERQSYECERDKMRLRCVAAIETQKRERSVVIGSYDR
ncbi:hypothetical protein JYU34_004067, partial [Plutella xylostella]